MRAGWILVAAALVTAGCPSNDGDDTEPASDAGVIDRDARKREIEGIVRMVQESQKKGLISQDLTAFMSIWTEDARLVEGRGTLPGPYDEVIPIKRVEGYWQRRGTDTGVTLDVEFKRVKATIDAERATLGWDTVITETQKATREVAKRVEHERWLLRKTDAGWRVYENRVWPGSKQRGTEAPVVFDEAKWAALDLRIEEAKRAKDDKGLLVALYDAQRWGEGHDLAVKVTSGPTAGETAWFWRAAFAMHLYFIDDAESAFVRQLELNPRANVPAWVKRPSQSNAAASAAPSAATSAAPAPAKRPTSSAPDGLDVRR